MSTESKKVWVVGHKNPDTDSICAAISYAYLKNQSGDKKTYVAKRAGAVNEETRYVLECFGVEEPPLVTYAGAQIKDINIRKTAGVSNQISLKRAWELMKKLEVVTLPVTNQFGKLEGVIVTKDIATSYMDVLDNCVLSKARTQYKTIAETIDGEVYAGNEHAHFVRGKVVIATSNPEYMADYIEDDDPRRPRGGADAGDPVERELHHHRRRSRGGGRSQKACGEAGLRDYHNAVRHIFRGASDQSEYADQAVHDQTGARHV